MDESMSRLNDAIDAHALREYPREACGLVVIIKGRRRYFPCVNVAATPGDQFMIDPAEYAEIEDIGEVVAVVHSHPDVNAQPSPGDLVALEASGLPWIIVAVHKQADGAPVIAGRTETRPSGYKAPLVGRQWQHGVLDCWALVRDWYAQERGITLPNPPRADEWWNDGHSNLYSPDALANAGLVKVAMQDIQPGDIILMQVRSRNLVPNHAGVYLGDGQMLHHMHGRLSTRDVFGGYWLECAVSLMRYNGVVES
ncbi:C40 family peptidase [Dyella caseinilytica]|uniref:C40 family peptidase n=1 Tax=Dyella caseinilytica TaxID=1849581 RepID=A0ABX7H1I5_9GAMM|nr:C40 family peptidase [Dyella caseinilytica]